MSAQLSWVRKIMNAVPEMGEIPLFGKAPSFHWKRLAQELARSWGIENVEILPRKQEFQEMKPDAWVAVEVAPIGLVFWAMSAEDQAKLTSWMLHGKKEKPLSSEILTEGFYRYLLCETLFALQTEEPLKVFTMRLSDEVPNFQEGCFCIELEIRFDGQSCWGTLAIPGAFRKQWIQYFENAPTEYTPTELSQTLNVNLGIKTGSFTLTQDEWEGIEAGDVVVLDAESYNAHKNSGMAVLVLGHVPLFQCKIKKNHVEIVDYALYYEEKMEEQQESVSIKETPVQVQVEIARLSMTLDKLMQLNPGNVLELPIHPDQSVSLVVNGQKVGRGELVYLGETLCVRVLEIG